MSTTIKDVHEGIIQMLSMKVVGVSSSQAIVSVAEKDDMTLGIDEVMSSGDKDEDVEYDTGCDDDSVVSSQ